MMRKRLWLVMVCAALSMGMQAGCPGNGVVDPPNAACAGCGQQAISGCQCAVQNGGPGNWTVRCQRQCSWTGTQCNSSQCAACVLVHTDVSTQQGDANRAVADAMSWQFCQ